VATFILIYSERSLESPRLSIVDHVLKSETRTEFEVSRSIEHVDVWVGELVIKRELCASKLE
jgi:hypothetical protein